MSKQTPLHEQHLALGGRMVDFAGWSLPVEFSGIIPEHKQVRTAAGLFDVSHMGEILITGRQAEELVQLLITSDVTRLLDNQITYSLFLNQAGGVVDDLLVYRYARDKYLLVVNAANTEKDYLWIKDHQLPDCQVEDVSDRFAQLAIQGPQAEAILQQLCPADLSALKFYWFLPETLVAGRPAMVSRTGYTGEQGFEIYLDPEAAPAVWQELLRVGGSLLVPVGLGARDTLRFEAKLPLYGQELGQDITPLEAGLGFFVHWDKGEFIGKTALKEQRASGLNRKLVEFEMVGRGIARAHYPVLVAGQVIGQVTSGSFAPTLGKQIGLALVDSRFAQPGQQIEIVIREKPVPALVGKGLFYTPAYKQKR